MECIPIIHKRKHGNSQKLLRKSVEDNERQRIE